MRNANAKCEMRMRNANAMRKRCDAMGVDRSANANAKNFSHYHPWLQQILAPCIPGFLNWEI
jgi:hypothetical protein